MIFRERWRDVVGFEGRYQVSDYGKVRRVGRTVMKKNPLTGYGPHVITQRLMALTPTSNGYVKVTLTTDDKKEKTFNVHQLVAAAFIGPVPVGMHCCHEDGIGSNNKRRNLRYDTPSGNNKDKERHGTWQIADKNGMTIINFDEASKIKRLLAEGRGSASIAIDLGIKKYIVDNIKYGKTWKHIDAEA